jgi:hypothetical protein
MEGRYQVYMYNELFEFLMFGKFLIYIFIKYLDVFLYIILHVVYKLLFDIFFIKV